MSFGNPEVGGEGLEFHLEHSIGRQVLVEESIHSSGQGQLQREKLGGIQLLHVSFLNVGKDFGRPLHPTEFAVRSDTLIDSGLQFITVQNSGNEFFLVFLPVIRAPAVFIFQFDSAEPIQSLPQLPPTAAIIDPAHHLQQFAVAKVNPR